MGRRFTRSNTRLRNPIAQCRDGNFQFSALAGAYVGNLHYMSAEWFHTNFQALFPTGFPANCLAALDGLAFAPSMKPIFDELIAGGVVDWALRQDMNGNHARESLLQRLGLSYLWGDERLDGPRFAYLYETRRIDDLQELARYFWMVRAEVLTDEQKERILRFWDRCVAWGTTLDPRSIRSSARPWLKWPKWGDLRRPAGKGAPPLCLGKRSFPGASSPDGLAPRAVICWRFGAWLSAMADP